MELSILYFKGLPITICIYNQAATKLAFHSNKTSKYEPRHDISNNVVSATSKASDQPAHTRSLVRDFASRMNILLVLSY